MIHKNKLLSTKLKYTRVSSFGMVLGLILWIGNVHGQTMLPQSINSTGAHKKMSQGSLSYTVGELMVLRLVDQDGNTLSSGFSAGSTVSVVSVQEPDPLVFDCRVYPNPTTDRLFLDIRYVSAERIRVYITDVHGKVVYEGNHAGISNTIGIGMSAQPAGMYFLTITDNHQKLLGSYKIIKP
jgi:hypothetical protein